jgi:hypothetical protein
MKQYTRDALLEQLRKGIVEVEFKKTNGDLRKMNCTLDQGYFNWESVADSVKKTPNLDVANVWDLDKSGWRSFRYDSVTRVKTEDTEVFYDQL